MQDMPLMLDNEMTAWEALRLLRQSKLVSKADAKLIKQLAKTEQPFPPHLHQALDLMYLLQVRPLTPSRH
jgi:hypothetical protein